MRRRTVSMTLGLVLTVTAMVWAYARDAKVSTLSPQDYAEIEHLTARLNQGADWHDSDMWVSVFTPDGVWTGTDGRAYVGRAGLTEYRRSRRAELGGRSDLRHWTNSLVLTPAADGATGRLYYMMMNVSTSPPTAVSAGHYEDVFAKTADGWRIKRRTIRVYPKDTAQ
jgi:SnoaL-like protein